MNSDMESSALVNHRLAVVGRLTAPVVHDLNNAMSPLVGKLQILQYKSETDTLESLTDLSALEEHAVSVSQRAQALSSLAREAVREEPNKPCVIVDCLREMDFLLGHHLRRRGVTVVLDTPASLPAITASAIDFKLVTADLMLLFLSAMPTGGQLHIACTSDERGAIMIAFSGVGIADTPPPFAELSELTSLLPTRGIATSLPGNNEPIAKISIEPGSVGG